MPEVYPDRVGSMGNSIWKLPFNAVAVAAVERQHRALSRSRAPVKSALPAQTNYSTNDRFPPQRYSATMTNLGHTVP